jgi:hypothetical protein
MGLSRASKPPARRSRTSRNTGDIDSEVGRKVGAAAASLFKKQPPQ